MILLLAVGLRLLFIFGYTRGMLHDLPEDQTNDGYDSIAEHGYYGGRPFRYRIPGYGEIDWTQFVASLVEIGYDGGIAIEHEDPVFSGERFEEGLVRGHDVLYTLIHPGAV